MEAVARLATPLLDWLIGPQCSHALTSSLVQFKPHVLFTRCFSLFVSKALGLGIVVTGAVVKLPQILKIVNARSATGVSPAAVALESFATSMSAVYNYRNANPFSTYGESVFITAQNLLILVLMAKYGRPAVFVAKVGLLGMVASVFVYLLVASPLSRSTLQAMQTLTIPINILSKLPQIFSNLRNRHTGQLSAIVVLAYFAGTVARVFTTLKEIPDDTLILAGHSLTCIFNFILLAQVLWYWNAKPASVKAKPIDKNSKKKSQ